MVHVALVCASLLAGQAGDRSPSPQDLRAYEALRLKAGKAPQAQVKLALWCEAHGLDAERLKHLAQAVLADPSERDGSRPAGAHPLRRTLGIAREDRRAGQGRRAIARPGSPTTTGGGPGWRRPSENSSGPSNA